MTRRERGMVTAEMAVLAPFGVAFGLLLLWIVSLGFTQVQLVDAAREAAQVEASGLPCRAVPLMMTSPEATAAMAAAAIELVAR